MPKDDLRMIVRVCRMYYLQDLTQAEIARQLFISRPQVCKLISRAKEINVISIHINDPFSEESKLSVALKERYRLSDAVVINLQGSEGTEALEALAKNLSILLSGYVSNGNMVGLSAGYALAACSAHTAIYNCKNLLFVPLIAGESSSGERWSANNNCRRFASRTNGKYLTLHAPLIIRQPAIRTELKDNDAIKPVFDSYDKLDVVVLGIGQTSPESTLGKCEISKAEIVKASEHGAKAIIGASFIDAGGNEILTPLSDIFFGIKAGQLKKCQSVIGVARGLDKVEAIKATLKGDYLSALCIDTDTAKGLLA